MQHGQPARSRTSPRRLLAVFSLLLLLPALLAAVAAYIATTHLNEVWAGRSEVMFHLSDMPVEASGRFLESQPIILTSRAVVEPVAHEEGLVIDDLMENLDARIVTNTNFLRIEYQDTDTERLQRVLESLTRGYLGVLRDVSAVEGASHRLLTPPFVMEKPVSPRPIQTAAIGAVLGLAIAFAGLVVMAQTSRPV